MKKIFSIISVAIVAMITVFMFCLCFIKTNIPLEYSQPKFINVYNRSTSAIGNKEFDSSSDKFNLILKELNEVTNISIFNRLVFGGSLNQKPQQDLENKFSKWSTEMKQENVVVELVFDKQQDAVVYFDGNSKVVSYFCLMYVIPLTTNYQDIVAYYATTNDSSNSAKETSYAECKPIVLQGMSKRFLKFVNTLGK